MPPSTRRVAHVPSWVDENIFLAAATTDVCGGHSEEAGGDGLCAEIRTTIDADNRDIAITSSTQQSMALKCSPSSVHINVGALRLLMPKPKEGGTMLSISRAMCGRTHVAPPPLMPSTSEAASDALVALEHALGKADDARFYGVAAGTNHVHKQHHQDRPLSSSLYGSHRQPDNPANAVSTYHTHSRSSVADVHQLFTPPPVTAAPCAAAPTTPTNGLLSSSAGGPLCSSSSHDHHVVVNVSNVRGTPPETIDGEEGGAPPPQLLFSDRSYHHTLSTQDLMLQLAARGAIRDSTLREFLQFRPAPLTSLTLSSNTAKDMLSAFLLEPGEDEDGPLDVYGAGGCVGDKRFAKVCVGARRAGSPVVSSTVRPPPKIGVVSKMSSAGTTKPIERPRQLHQEPAAPQLDVFSASATAAVVPLLSRRAPPPNRNIKSMAVEGTTSTHATLSPLRDSVHPSELVRGRPTTMARLPGTAAGGNAATTTVLDHCHHQRRASSLQPQSSSNARRWAGQNVVASQEELRDFLSGVLQ
jgi:hypothetical protein